MSAEIDLGAVKQIQQKVWSEGDFSMVAGLVMSTAEGLAESLAILPGEMVLDVACGSGNGAIAAARRAWGNTTGADFVPELLERGRERAAAERLEIELVEADAEDLPFGDGSFDVVMSIYGAMFAPDQPRTAAELLRVCKPGGRIGMANWVPDGFIGEMFMTTAKHAPMPPGLDPPILWGTEERLRELFGEEISDLRVTRRTMRAALLLGRPLARGLPHLFRSDQGRLRASRAGRRGGAGVRPAGAARALQRSGRAGAGDPCRLPRGDRYQGLSFSISGFETRSATPMKSTVEEDQPGDRSTLADRVGEGHRERGRGIG